MINLFEVKIYLSLDILSIETFKLLLIQRNVLENFETIVSNEIKLSSNFDCKFMVFDLISPIFLSRVIL